MMAAVRFFLGFMVLIVPIGSLISCPRKNIWEQLVCELHTCELKNRQINRPFQPLNLYAHTIEDCLKMCSQEIQYFKKMLSQLSPHELEARDAQGFRLLDLAVQYRLFYHMRYLLEAGSNPNISVPGHITTLDHLITHTAAFDCDDLTFKCLDLLLCHGANINATGKYGDSLLMNAIKNRVQSEVIQYLISRGVNIEYANNDGYTALSYAISNAELEVVKVLVQAGAQYCHKNRYGRTPLHIAAQAKDPHILPAVLEGIKIDSEKIDKSLLALAQAGNVRIGSKSPARMLTQFLLQQVRSFLQPTTINELDNDGNSALHLAVGSSVFGNIFLLLQAGANQEITNKRGETPAQYSGQ